MLSKSSSYESHADIQNYGELRMSYKCFMGLVQNLSNAKLSSYTAMIATQKSLSTNASQVTHAESSPRPCVTLREHSFDVLKEFSDGKRAFGRDTRKFYVTSSMSELG